MPALLPVRIPPDLFRQLGRAGPLERPWLTVAIATVLAASIALALWRGRRHRRAGRRPSHLGLRRAALGVWFSLLVLLGSAAGLNAYVGYLPTVPTLFGSLPGHPTGVRFSRVRILLVGDRALHIPPEQAYVRYELVQPMLVVAPNASGGWMHDSEMLNQVGGPQIETYLTNTVVAAVDARYRTIPDRSARAIGGMSSGGYGALNLGLRHQGTYSVILSMMPYGDPGAVTRTLLGGSRRLWLANSPGHYIPTMAFSHPMAVFLAAGSRDPQLREARLLARMFSSRGQLAVVRLVPGANHTWHGARRETPYALAFASQHLTASVRPLFALVGRPAAAASTRTLKPPSPTMAGTSSPPR